MKAPLGKDLAVLAKKYVSVFTNKLQNLTIDRYYYPLILINNNKLTQQQLAEKLVTDKVTIVRIIDYLSKNGMVRRKQNPSDRREYILELTESGKEAIPDIENAIEELNGASFSGLTEDERCIFYKGLEVINLNLSSIPENNHYEWDIRKKKIK